MCKKIRDSYRRLRAKLYIAPTTDIAYIVEIRDKKCVTKLVFKTDGDFDVINTVEAN